MHTNCQKSVDNKRNSTNVPCEAIGQLLVDHFHQIFGTIHQVLVELKKIGIKKFSNDQNSWILFCKHKQIDHLNNS